MRKLLTAVLGGLAILTLGSGVASAVPFDVFALTHSSQIDGFGVVQGTPLATGLFFDTGDTFTATADPDDVWRAGNDSGGVRESNADGLTGLPPHGGSDFGLVTGDGFSAHFGTLVGRLGTQYFVIGTSFSSGPLLLSGPTQLELFYWDTFTPDNTGSVRVDIQPGAVPEPATLLLLGSGLSGLALRRRRSS
jgi:PEP-CTERM motif